MKVFIFHKVNPELTLRACRSVVDAGLTPVVIDNSLKNDLETYEWCEGWLSPKVYSLAALHNWVCELTVGYFWMHNDVTAPKETFDALIKAYKGRWGRTGAIFANYDRLCWFNSEAIMDAGGWDLALPQYFSDTDMYRRLRLKKWSTEELGLPLIHDHSNTIKDPEHHVLNENTFDLYGTLYMRKWGGLPFEETFLKPYNTLDF